MDNKQLTADTVKLSFEVEDTGPGIAPSDLERLFDPFLQTETGRNSQQGTGLGLAISQKFVGLMGGKISVRSTLGKGTIFAFDVRMTLSEAGNIPTKQPSQRVIALAPNQPKYRILIVDDRWENRQLLLKLLAPVGFEVREAKNGQEAVELWQSWAPHLIWMDIRMPVMDGYEATTQIKARERDRGFSRQGENFPCPMPNAQSPTTVIIAVTASAFEEERTVILAGGCDDFVGKPFREDAIFEKMAKHLGVLYVYEEKAEVFPSPQDLPLPRSQMTQMLAVMSPEWIAQLHQAATRLNAKLVFQVLEQIPQENAPLAEALLDLVDNFRFDLIIELTQSSAD